MVGPREKFSKYSFSKDWKRHFEIGFANTEKTTFNHTFFQMLYKYYVVFSS